MVKKPSAPPDDQHSRALSPDAPVDPPALNRPPAFASEDLLLIRRNRWILGLTLSPLLIAAGLTLVALLTGSVDPSVAPQLAAVGVVLTFIA